MAKAQKRGEKPNAKKETVKQTVTKADVLKPIYTGKVIVNEFSIKDKTYNLGDEYSTENKFNYDTLIKQKRIK